MPLFSFPSRKAAGAVLAVTCLAILAPAVAAQDKTKPQTGYRTPPKEIVDLVDAPPTPFVTFSPDNQWMLFLGRPQLPSIAEVAQPELRLAGVRINPDTNGVRRVGSYLNKLSFRRLQEKDERPVIGLPAGAQIGFPIWSPDGKRIAFTVTEARSISLWTAEAETARAKVVAGVKLNETFGTSISWLPDGRSMICLAIPDKRGTAPAVSTTPEGPIIQENEGKKAPVRTNPDLLKNPQDEALFEYHGTSQILRVSIDGQVAAIGKPGLFAEASPSPDGKYLLVQKIRRPFSYLVAYSQFPKQVEIWNDKGGLVKQLAELPLAEEIALGFDAVAPGPRDFSWRPDAPASVYWLEAQDGGDPRKKADIRDKAFTLAAPFSGNPRTLASFALRHAGFIWGENNLALCSEFEWKSRKVRTRLIRPDSPEVEPKTLFELSFEDRYNNPGVPVMRQTKFGTPVLMTAPDGKSIFLTGDGASPEGDRPFLDRFNVETGEKERLWRSEAPYYAQVSAVLDASADRVVMRRETKTDPPNYFLFDLKTKSLDPLTAFPHPYPQLKDVQKEQIRYERADGVKLTATLYLPAGYTPDKGPLPVMMWVYPQEFKTADAAGQVTDSPYRFTRISIQNALFLVTRGYAVLDDPTLPIVAQDGKESNDTYVKQLLAGAEAAINELVRRKIADPKRVAVGGHSYGAFTTVNLLAHSDLFRTGIARSGAYNRTLTPFGFQSEERILWQAQETYLKMSPFLYADKINEPLLLIHGEADDNPGTYPIQSERLYQAMKGLGGTVRYVVLPRETHGYRARESMMHVLWEMTEWLDKHVKNAPGK